MKIIVYSDYICPFCFIGEAIVERLKEEYRLETDWRGFEIHPEVPPEGVPLERIRSPYFQTVKANVMRMAQENDLDIRFPPLLSNSRLALEGAEYAKDAGKFQPYHEALFRAYFQESCDIGDMRVLTDLATKVGLDPADFEDCLATGRMGERLAQYRAETQENLITGVPTFLIGDGRIVGAQEYNVFTSLIERVLKKPQAK